MISKLIRGFQHIYGRSQGYDGLAVRHEIINCTVNGHCPAMTTAWEPTPKELELLNAGRSVHIRILGSTPPPMAVFVDEDEVEDNGGTS